MDRADAGELRHRLDGQTQSVVETIDSFPTIDSTNSYLLGQPPPRAGRASAALADHQTAGRGRLNNRWHSPPGSGLYLSIAYTFAGARDDLPSLTLAAGVALLHALEDLGVDGVTLKWPNDIVLNDGKLGGILTELHPTTAATPTVIIGTGMNIDVQDEMQDIVTGVGRVADLREAMPNAPEPLELAAAVLRRLARAVIEFEQSGLGPFLGTWRKNDWLADRDVRVDSNTERLFGVAAGIDDDGALLLRRGEDLVRVISGTVVPDEGRPQ